MKKKYVLDTSVYLTYASHNKLYRLLDIAKRYDLIFYASEHLIAEIFKNAARVIKTPTLSPEDVLKSIRKLADIVNTIPDFNRSPDPKDNFLFDLAIQTGSEIIVTKETALLNFADSPVAIHDIKWFKETFPVPL